jgi:hypothetical protein
MPEWKNLQNITNFAPICRQRIFSIVFGFKLVDNKPDQLLRLKLAQNLTFGHARTKKPGNFNFPGFYVRAWLNVKFEARF